MSGARRLARRLARGLAVLAVACLAYATLGCGGDDYLQEGLFVQFDLGAAADSIETSNVDPIFGTMAPLSSDPTSGWADGKELLDAAPAAGGSLYMLYKSGSLALPTAAVQLMLVDFVSGLLTPSGAPAPLTALDHLGKLTLDGDLLWALEKGSRACTGVQALSTGLAPLTGSPATTPLPYVGGQVVAEGGHLYLVGVGATNLFLMHYTASGSVLAWESSVDLGLPSSGLRDDQEPVRVARSGDRLMVVAYYNSTTDRAQGVRLDPTTGRPSAPDGLPLALSAPGVGPLGNLVASGPWFYAGSGGKLHALGFGGLVPSPAPWSPSALGWITATPLLAFRDLLYYVTEDSVGFGGRSLRSAKVQSGDGTPLPAYRLDYDDDSLATLHRTGQLLFKQSTGGITVVRTDLVAGTLELVPGSPYPCGTEPQTFRVVLKP